MSFFGKYYSQTSNYHSPLIDFPDNPSFLILYQQILPENPDARHPAKCTCGKSSPPLILQINPKYNFDLLPSIVRWCTIPLSLLALHAKATRKIFWLTQASSHGYTWPFRERYALRWLLRHGNKILPLDQARVHKIGTSK